MSVENGIGNLVLRYLKISWPLLKIFADALSQEFIEQVQENDLQLFDELSKTVGKAYPVAVKKIFDTRIVNIEFQ